MRRTRSLTLALAAIVGVALIATGYGVAQLTSVETEVRVVVRPHEDGRVEFAVQQRVDDEWGERIEPASRYLTPALIEQRVGRWLNSSPITLTVAVEGDGAALESDSGSSVDSDDDEQASPHAAGSYEPVIASNFDTAPAGATLLYEASEDVFGEGVRTDVRMIGDNGALLLNVVCYAHGQTAMAFWLLRFDRPERDADGRQELEVVWRFNTGPINRDTLGVEFVNDIPVGIDRSTDPGFDADWSQVLNGGRLAVRIGYRGVQEEVFDLDAFAQTPVHQNLVNCGNY